MNTNSRPIDIELKNPSANETVDPSFEEESGAAGVSRQRADRREEDEGSYEFILGEEKSKNPGERSRGSEIVNEVKRRASIAKLVSMNRRISMGINKLHWQS